MKLYGVTKRINLWEIEWGGAAMRAFIIPDAASPTQSALAGKNLSSRPSLQNKAPRLCANKYSI